MKRKRIKVYVTEEHMRRGDRRDEARCPITLALKDAGIGMKALGNCNDPVTLPRSVRDYINRLDDGESRYSAPKYFYVNAGEVAALATRKER